MNAYKLEPEFEKEYSAWKTDPSPSNSTKLLQKLRPISDRAITMHVGKSSKNMHGQAKKIILNTLPNYDPTKAGLSTYLTHQLQALKRVARTQTQVLKIPERILIDQGRMVEATNELKDRLGRDPTDTELADFAGFSTKRLEHIRKFAQPLAEGTVLKGIGDEESGGFIPGTRNIMGEDLDPWIEAVYFDADPVSKKIIEWTFGLHGSKTLTNKEIASRLGLSPGAISQRKAVIQKQINSRPPEGFI